MRVFVLGASDPEMSAIENLLRLHQEKYVFACANGRRVLPGNATHPDGLSEAIHDMASTVYAVETRVDKLLSNWTTTIHNIDHHAPGDPGFGRHPSEYWEASSIGQVVEVLRSLGHDVTITAEMRMVAAADHCLGAAYRGDCPGVDPDLLMEWRVKTRAMFQGRDFADILADIAAAREALRSAPEIEIAPGVYVRDMRRDTPIPELPDAATREGVGYISGPLVGQDGRTKYTCSGTPEQVQAWMKVWAPAAGLTGIYGDPARGFAGGYAEVHHDA